jgi:hypothetical protein
MQQDTFRCCYACHMAEEASSTLCTCQIVNCKLLIGMQVKAV